MGLGLVLGRIAIGLAADRIGKVYTLRYCIAVLALSSALWPLATNTGSVFAFALVYGFHAGAYPSLPPSIIADLFQEVPGASSFLFRLTGLQFSADVLGAILGPPIAGWIFDSTGSYSGAAAFTAASLAAGLASLLCIPSKEEHEKELAERLEEGRRNPDDTLSTHRVSRV